MILKALFACLLTVCLSAGSFKSSLAGEIMIAKGNFTDKERNRVVPYKLYLPVEIEGKAPIVIFSHGLGGSYDAAPYLGAALAENGYLAIFIQHHGSDKSLWEGTAPGQIAKKLGKAISSPRVSANRYQDLIFIIDELERQNKGGGPLEGKIDLDRVGHFDGFSLANSKEFA